MEVDIESMSSKECFFTLVASKMIKLSEKYEIPLSNLHSMFFSVNCDFHLLQAMLDQQSTINWNTFEDMALMESEENESYNYILETKGEEAVKERR